MKLNITSKILSTLSRALGFVGLVMVISAVAFTVPAAFATPANGPEWNTGSTASEQNWFQVSNAIQGGDWANSISGVKAGDVVNFRVYMHNNTCPANDAAGNTSDKCPANVAHSAYVHVTLPQVGGTVTANIGSNETAANIARSLSLVLPSGQTIAYKAGSTRIVHNQIDPNTFWPMPNTSVTENAGDNVTSGNLDQGDIAGCYSNSRYITFQAVVSNVVVGTPTPAVTPAKPAVLAAVTQTPATGPESAPILALIGMIPAGLVLRRFKV